jgi:hypothetical protein
MKLTQHARGVEAEGPASQRRDEMQQDTPKTEASQLGNDGHRRTSAESGSAPDR